MEQLRELISFLKMYHPKVYSSQGDHQFIKRAVVYRNGQDPETDTVYLGFQSEICSLLRFYNNSIFFIISDSGPLPKDWNNNYCVVFPKETKIDMLLEDCRNYFTIQTQLHEYSHILLESYLEGGSVQSMLTEAAKMIGNPIMIIDTNYRILYECSSDPCSDIVWNESIRNGYCSYEFVTQFNQLQEVRSIQSSKAFMSGCLNSPLRRCICKIQKEGNLMGYLLSIEQNTPFDQLKIQTFNLISRILYRAMAETNTESFNNLMPPVDDLFVDMLKGKLKSKEVLKNYLHYSGVEMNSDYYLVSFNIEKYNYQDADAHYSLDQALFKRFNSVLSACIETNILMLIKSSESLNDFADSLMIHQDYLRENGIIVSVSDKFNSLETVPVSFKQTNFVHSVIKQLQINRTICTYDSVRILDIIASRPTLHNYQDLIGTDLVKIHEYDEMHGTEYFKTLYYYIRWNRNLSKAASILHIHRNTVSYRVQRAKELFSLDMDDFYVAAKIFLSYLIFMFKDNGVLKGDGDE